MNRSLILKQVLSFELSMIKIRGISIPSFDLLKESQIVSMFDQVLESARKNRLTAAEHEQLEFKILPHTDADELRKDFAAFANTEGGILAIGIDDRRIIVEGVNGSIDDDRLRQILSAKSKIQSPPQYTSRIVTIEGKQVFLYEIWRSPLPVRVHRKGIWIIYCRFGGQVRDMSPYEYVQRFHPGLRVIPNFMRLKPEQLGVYNLEGVRVAPYVCWKIENQQRLFEWLQLPYSQTIIPVPAPVDPLTHTGKKYMAGASWSGLKDELFGEDGILANFEQCLDKNFGFISEFWTVTKKWSPTLGHAKEYMTGCRIQDINLVVEQESDSWALAWLVMTGQTLYILDADISKETAYLSMNASIRFIPNNFPFVSFDLNGHVDIDRLQVVEVEPFEAKTWSRRMPQELFLDEAPDDLLAGRPAGRIESYIGGPPKSRDKTFFSRASGLTLIEITSGNDFGRDVPPLISSSSHIFTRLASGPTRMNDRNELRITGSKCDATTVPELFREIVIVPFEVATDVNQLSGYKLQPVKLTT